MGVVYLLKVGVVSKNFARKRAFVDKNPLSRVLDPPLNVKSGNICTVKAAKFQINNNLLYCKYM